MSTENREEELDQELLYILNPSHVLETLKHLAQHDNETCSGVKKNSQRYKTVNSEHRAIEV